MTIQEAAKQAGCHYQTIYQNIRKGKLRATKKGKNGHWKLDIKEEDLKEFMSGPPETLTTEEVALIKGCSKSSISAAIRRGTIKPYTKVGRKNYFRVCDIGKTDFTMLNRYEAETGKKGTLHRGFFTIAWATEYVEWLEDKVKNNLHVEDV